MAYQTGTESSFAALKTTIETFATSNGWTLTSGVLHKGQSNIKLLVETNARVSNNVLVIRGANSVDFLTEPAPAPRVLYAAPASFPITYHLFVHTVPDIIVCVITFNSLQQQVLMFGEIVKVDASAFVGGNFFFASLDYTFPDLPASVTYLSKTTLGMNHGTNSAYDGAVSIPFAYRASYAGIGTPLHCKIDGYIWNDYLNNIIGDYTIRMSQSTLSSYSRSPNTADSQAHLVPIHLEFAMASSLFGYIGYMEHLRLIKVNNYNIGDIVTLGADKWKVFPWGKKDLTYPNGSNSQSVMNTLLGQHNTADLGFAVRYDGP